MDNQAQKGFIQIPLLIAVVLGVLGFGGVGYSKFIEHKEDAKYEVLELENTNEEILDVPVEDVSEEIKDVEPEKVIEIKEVKKKSVDFGTPAVTEIKKEIKSDDNEEPLKKDIEKLIKENKRLTEEVEDIKDDIKDLEEIEKEDAFYKLTPVVTLSQDHIRNDGKDTIEIGVESIDEKGNIVPNVEFEISIYVEKNGYSGEELKDKDTIKTNSDGIAKYETIGITDTNYCGVFFIIKVTDHNDFSYARYIKATDTQRTQGTGMCP